jgi:hypothetical protein
MPNAATVCTLLGLLTLPIPIAGQDRPADPTKPPEKGSTITIKGCIVGSSSLHDAESGLTYRLKGEKAFLKKLGEEHKGHVDEITGILQTSLQMGGTKGKRVGNTVISIGPAEPMRSSPTPREINPVLEVKSIEHTAILCVK